MMNEVYEEIARCLREGVPIALATVAETRGSTPRRKGARMVVKPDGTFCGTIGGGCGEAEVWSEAMGVLQTGVPKLVTVDLTNPLDGDDKICGGLMDIWVERLNPA